jgi:DNA repair exonuclease SbcCD ATPase subunit
LLEAVKNSTKITSADQEIHEVVKMAHGIEGEGLADMVPREVEELLQEPNYELTQEDLDELIESSTDVEGKEEEEETNVNQWMLESFEDLFKYFRNLKHKIRELDPSVERRRKIARELEQAFESYTMLYNEMKQKKKKERKEKKQLPITLFFRKGD